MPTLAPKSKKVRDRARKKAKAELAKKPAGSEAPVVKHKLTTKDLLDQAQAVAGRVEVPDGLILVLRRAIRARQRCAEWFTATKVRMKLCLLIIYAQRLSDNLQNYPNFLGG